MARSKSSESGAARLAAAQTSVTEVRTSAARAGKVRKSMWLDRRLLYRARKLLGTSSDRETVETALAYVCSGSELAQGIRAFRGLKLARIE